MYSIPLQNETICDTFCNLHVVFVGHSAIPWYLTIAPNNNNIGNGKLNVKCVTKSVVCKKGTKKTIWHTVSYVECRQTPRYGFSVFFSSLHSFICCSCNLCDSSFYYRPPLGLSRFFPLHSATYVYILNVAACARARDVKIQNHNESATIVIARVCVCLFVLFVSFWSSNT